MWSRKEESFEQCFFEFGNFEGEHNVADKISYYLFANPYHNLLLLSDEVECQKVLTNLVQIFCHFSSLIQKYMQPLI